MLKVCLSFSFSCVICKLEIVRLFQNYLVRYMLNLKQNKTKLPHFLFFFSVPYQEKEIFRKWELSCGGVYFCRDPYVVYFAEKHIPGIVIWIHEWIHRWHLSRKIQSKEHISYFLPWGEYCSTLVWNEEQVIISEQVW